MGWGGWKYEGDGFAITYLDKEVVEYREGDRGFWFDAGWSANPPELLVPSAEIWAEVMPDWLVDRRGEVISRLALHSGHVLADDIHGHYRNDPQRRLTTYSG